MYSLSEQAYNEIKQSNMYKEFFIIYLFYVNHGVGSSDHFSVSE